MRFLYYIQNLPKRFLRLAQHLRAVSGAARIDWWVELFIFLVELIGLAECYEAVNALLLPGVRAMNAHEQAVAQSVFGKSLNYQRILIDEHAAIACKKGNLAYVSFYIVNHFGRIDDWHLIHELMHVWQYERVGAPYIWRAVRAQHSSEGYNYGGVTALIANAEQGLSAFNYEQQADIVADYYRIKSGAYAQWSSERTTTAYQPYIDELTRK